MRPYLSVNVDELCSECRNWDRWGDATVRGTLNYITPQKIESAARLVRTGRVISLSLPVDRNGPQSGSQRRFNPMTFMLRDGRDTLAGETMGAPRGYGTADDILLMPVHASTHWDALCHVFWDGKMWGGLSAELVSSNGAASNGVEELSIGVVSRGVLLDIPRLHGLAYLEPGYPITPEDLDHAAELEHVSISPGDVLLIRTGDVTRARSAGDLTLMMEGDSAGLSILTARWLRDREVAAVAADNYSVEVKPAEVDWPRPRKPGSPNPWHRVAIANMGLVVGELFDLDELADDCAADRRYEFLFVAAPLPITGATGSPVNPLAIK